MLSALLLAAFVALSPISPPIAPAGDDPTCHGPWVLPTVTEWTIVAGTGAILVDARLSGYPNLSQYYAPDPTNEADWRFSMTLWPLGQPGPYTHLRGHGATVTDSTFRYEIPLSAGTYVYVAGFGGTVPGEADVCTSPYFMTDTLTVLPDPSPAARVSFGALKARWR